LIEGYHYKYKQFEEGAITKFKVSKEGITVLTFNYVTPKLNEDYSSARMVLFKVDGENLSYVDTAFAH
jgi:hypothetical protein